MDPTLKQALKKITSAFEKLTTGPKKVAPKKKAPVKKTKKTSKK